jgi:hypothetical protein
MAINYA